MSDGNDLISFIASMSGEGNLRVEENLGDGFVRLRVSEAERRQAKHDIQHVEDIVVEMLRNARDAGARNIYLATSKEEGVRTLLFLDDGSGVPEDMRDRIFDARQAKHDIQHVEDIVVEMLRNARDAGARNIYLATSKEEGVRTLLFLDDGSGVPEDMRDRIFDARVTSKRICVIASSMRASHPSSKACVWTNGVSMDAVWPFSQFVRTLKRPRSSPLLKVAARHSASSSILLLSVSVPTNRPGRPPQKTMMAFFPA